MSTTYSPATEKRARDMYKDSRRGVQMHVQWSALPELQKTEWLVKAKEIEDVIAARLKQSV